MAISLPERSVLCSHMWTNFANVVGLHQLKITYLGCKEEKDECFNIKGGVKSTGKTLMKALQVYSSFF